MKEKPRTRDEKIISKPMMTQISIMGLWLTILSFWFLTSDYIKTGFFTDLEGVYLEAQHYTAYFVLFIVAALFNGFNVRDDGFDIFKGLNENTGFMRVFFAIIFIQASIINLQLIPFVAFEWIGAMFSCVPFSQENWVIVVGLALSMIPIDLIRKIVTK